MNWAIIRPTLKVDVQNLLLEPCSVKGSVGFLEKGCVLAHQILPALLTVDLTDDFGHEVEMLAGEFETSCFGD
jgi:hypothetical protein